MAVSEARPADADRRPTDRIRRFGRHRLLASAALATLTITGLAARLPEYGQPLWGDEVSSARTFSHNRIADVLSAVRLRKSEPPAWYALMWAMHRGGAMIGQTPTIQALRVTSILLSLGTTAVVFIYARRFLGDVAAFAAAAITAFGSQFVLHGAELRGYAMFSFLSAALALILDQTLRSPRRVWPVLLGLTTAAGCYTHYFFILTVVAAGGYLWADRGRAGRRLIAGGALAAGIASLAPWLPFVVARLHRYTYIGHFSGHTVVSLPWNLVTGYLHVDALVRDEQLLLFAVALLGCWLLLKDPEGRLAASCALFPPLVGAIAWYLGKPVYDPRNFAGAAPFIAIALATPLSKLRKGMLQGAVTGLVIVGILAAFWQTQATLGRTAYDTAAQAMTKAGWRYAAPIVFFGSDPWGMRTLTWYLPHHQWMVRSVPRAGTCTDVYAVVQTAKGYRWLRSIPRSNAVVSMANFGSAPESHAHAVRTSVVKLTHVSPAVLILARLDGGSVFVSAPAPALTLNAPQPKPYPFCHAG